MLKLLNFGQLHSDYGSASANSEYSPDTDEHRNVSAVHRL